MKALYELVGTTKQALHKFNRVHVEGVLNQVKLIQQATAIRKRHPQLGCRSMYNLLKDPDFGRDECEQILLANGFRIKRKPNFIKTTVTQRTHKFPNLIRGLEIQGINHVWQTDITYFIVDSVKVLYLIFIIDIYSRRIIGYTAHDHMRGEANVACLRMAIKCRKGYDLSKLIHHSDCGSQHVFKQYLELLKPFKISMSKQAWQNAYSERINGTIKNDYLKHRKIQSLSDLRANLTKDIFAYNNERPHKSLPEKMSPIRFEEYLKRTPKIQHPVLKIYDHEKDERSGELTLTQNEMETLFQFP
jgi:transposase InsO family protein